eukprot:1145617-Pelagomonas_calceolata.AAC.6
MGGRQQKDMLASSLLVCLARLRSLGAQAESAEHTKGPGSKGARKHAVSALTKDSKCTQSADFGAMHYPENVMGLNLRHTTAFQAHEEENLCHTVTFEAHETEKEASVSHDGI